MSREVATREDSGDHCPDHVGTAFGPCTSIGCTNMEQAQMLEDRAAAIGWLVARARDAVLHGNGDASDGLSVAAALEAVRVLARSITDAGSITEDGDDSPALWSVFSLSPRPQRLAAAPEEATS